MGNQVVPIQMVYSKPKDPIVTKTQHAPKSCDFVDPQHVMYILHLNVILSHPSCVVKTLIHGQFLFGLSLILRLGLVMPSTNFEILKK